MSQRNTVQKVAILEVLTAAKFPLGVDQILSKGQQAVPTLSLATVYRVIKQLLEQGDIETVQLPGQPSLYELAGKTHHHFFRCRECEKMYEVKGCDDLVKRLIPRGFRLEEHEVFLRGVCSTCSE